MASGRVTVNGRVVSDMGSKADPDRDDIKVDGKPLNTGTRRVYLALNKPAGFVTTVSDPHAERTVMELVKGIRRRVYPAGRLDADTTGLLLLTDDGDFAMRVTHPSHQLGKVYRVLVQGEVSEFAATDLRTGVMLEDGITAPAEVEWVGYDKAGDRTMIDITLHEGRNRQVRRMMEAVGYRVMVLHRRSVGPVDVGNLAPGEWRYLTEQEVAALMAATQGAAPGEDAPADEVEPVVAAMISSDPPPPPPARAQRPARSPRQKVSLDARRPPQPEAPFRPRGTGSRPGGGVTRPGTGGPGSRPGTSGPRPDGAGPRPSGAGAKPDGYSPRPSGPGPRPNTGGTRPEGAGPRPGASGSKPGGAAGGPRKPRPGGADQKQTPPDRGKPKR